MTDTTNNTVLNPPQPATAPVAPDTIVSGSRWAWAPAVLGLVGLLGICAATLLPATVVAEKENQRLMEMQEAPYAQVPASAESVNDRVLFGSDWPHIEGMPRPLDYLPELNKLDRSQRREVLHDNAAQLVVPAAR